MFHDALRKLLGLVEHNPQPQHPQLPMAQMAQPIQQGLPIQLGNVQGIEGFAPQDTYGRGELDTNNLLQPSYDNPQASLNGGYQQGGYNPPQLPSAADPFGWQQGQDNSKLRLRY